MPYEPDTASEKYREGEREVRYTIIRLIRDHLQDTDPKAPTTTWRGRDLDFTNATFDGGDFTGVKFTGGEVSFVDAEFSGSVVSFRFAKFTGGQVLFDGAKFTGGEVFFEGAEFTGATVDFDDTEFTTGCSIKWGPFEPPPAWTALQARGGDRTNHLCSSAVTSVFGLGSCGASRRQRRCDQWLARLRLVAT
jgi:hypothetical protein